MSRHEEAAALMASGWAKHTEGLGVCVGTTGPGAIHLMNGLYDAAFDGAPVVALTGLTFHDLRGVRYQQGVDTAKLMEPLAVYNEEVTGPEHAILIANRACRAALGNRGVAHLAISKDVQLMKLSADKRSMRNPGARSSSSWSPPLSAPPSDQLKAAAAVLNAASRVAVLAGQGALSARDEVTQLADMLGAPVAKALLGKAVLPDDSPFTRIPKEQLFIFEAPVPGQIETDAIASPQGVVPQSMILRKSDQKTDKGPGGTVRIVDTRNFPIAAEVAAAIVEVTPKSTREIHWHPNADEWQYYLFGTGRMTVFASQDSSRTFDFRAGDVGYVPKSMSHYVQNTGDVPLKFLELFQSSRFEDVSLNQWLALTPAQLVKSHLGLDQSTIDHLNKNKRPIV